MSAPRILQEPLYQMLRSEQVKEFNSKVDRNAPPELTGCDFRGLDLRGLDASQLDLSDAYFRGSDLRGIDFRATRLEGASIASAKISGCYFPAELTAEEITLSLNQGTRMRYRV